MNKLSGQEPPSGQARLDGMQPPTTPPHQRKQLSIFKAGWERIEQRRQACKKDLAAFLKLSDSQLINCKTQGERLIHELRSQLTAAERLQVTHLSYVNRRKHDDLITRINHQLSRTSLQYGKRFQVPPQAPAKPRSSTAHTQVQA